MYHRYPPDYRQFDPKLATDRYRSISCLHTAPFAVLSRVVRRRAPLSTNDFALHAATTLLRIFHEVFPKFSLSFPQDLKVEHASNRLPKSARSLRCFYGVSTGICRRSSGNLAKTTPHSPHIHPTFTLTFRTNEVGAAGLGRCLYGSHQLRSRRSQFRSVFGHDAS